MDSDNITFSFGENWKNYLKTIDDSDISSANEDILDWLSISDIKDKKIIDIGCGSGLHSFCLYGNGAEKLTSIDVDPHSVEATNTLKDRAGSNDFTILIDCTPQVLLLPVNFHKHFVDIKCITVTLVLSFQSPGVLRTKLIAPQTNRFITDFNTAFC